MSGTSVGGVDTPWYVLQVYGGISIEPAEGSEELIYGQMREEGKAISQRLGPYAKQFEEVVQKAKARFSAPIVLYEQNKDGGYIDGVISEDVSAFDPDTISSETDPKQRREIIEYEEQLFKKIKADEARKKQHFLQYYENGSHIYVEFHDQIPNSFLNYTFKLAVNGRIRRSTLNWIRQQIKPDLIEALRGL